MYKMTIKVTKDILERSKMCENGLGSATNCAIALAVRDIFPHAYVDTETMWFDKNQVGNLMAATTGLPDKASRFIVNFDNNSPENRVKMKEIEFDIVVPDEVIEKINIDEITTLLVNHLTLKLELV